MKFLSFKDFLISKCKEEDELDDMIYEMAEEGLWELRNNPLYNIDKISDYSTLAESLINEKKKKELSDEEKNIVNQLQGIFCVFYPCVKYLGHTRVKKIMTDYKREKNRIKQIKQNDKNATTNQDRKRVDDSYRDEQIKLYNIAIKYAREKDESGRDDIKLVISGGRNIEIVSKNSTVNEGVGETISRWISGFGKWVKDCLKAIFGKGGGGSGGSGGKELNTSLVDKMYPKSSLDIEKNPGCSDDEKKEAGVTWTKKVSNKDIKIMNFGNKGKSEKINKDVDSNKVNGGGTEKYKKSFFKTIALLAIKFDPKILNTLMEGVISQDKKKPSGNNTGDEENTNSTQNTHSSDTDDDEDDED